MQKSVQLVGALLTVTELRFQVLPFVGLTGASVYSTSSENESTEMMFTIYISATGR